MARKTDLRRESAERIERAIRFYGLQVCRQTSGSGDILFTVDNMVIDGEEVSIQLLLVDVVDVEKVGG